MRFGHIPGGSRSHELVELLELPARDLLWGGGERLHELQRGHVLIDGGRVGLLSVRRGHLLVGGLERLHGLRCRDLPRVDGRDGLHELRRGVILGGGGNVVRELCGGDLPKRERVVKLRGVRPGYIFRQRGRIVVFGVRGVRVRLVLGQRSERVHELRRRYVLGKRVGERMLFLSRG